MRPRALGLVAAVSVAVLGAGCQSAVSTSPVPDSAIRSLEQAPGPPLYFAGRSFAGLPLTRAESSGPGRALFVYGSCKPSGGLFADGGCGPPVQIQEFPFRPADWRRAYECHRLPTIRGVPTARHDGLVLFTDRSIVKIYSRSAAEDARIAGLLRPVNRPESRGRLPQPPAALVALIDTACGPA